MDLLSSPRFFPPPSIPDPLLSSSFLRTDSPRDQLLLQQHLGVTSITRTTFYRKHLFPAIAEAAEQAAVIVDGAQAAASNASGRSSAVPEASLNLPAGVRDSAMLAVLEDMDELAAEDAGFLVDLRQLAFVPTGSGELKRASRWVWTPAP